MPKARLNGPQTVTAGTRRVFELVRLVTRGAAPSLKSIHRDLTLLMRNASPPVSSRLISRALDRYQRKEPCIETGNSSQNGHSRDRNCPCPTYRYPGPSKHVLRTDTDTSWPNAESRIRETRLGCSFRKPGTTRCCNCPNAGSSYMCSIYRQPGEHCSCCGS